MGYPFDRNSRLRGQDGVENVANLAAFTSKLRNTTTQEVKITFRDQICPQTETEGHCTLTRP